MASLLAGVLLGLTGVLLFHLRAELIDTAADAYHGIADRTLLLRFRLRRHTRHARRRLNPRAATITSPLELILSNLERTHGEARFDPDRQAEPRQPQSDTDPNFAKTGRSQ